MATAKKSTTSKTSPGQPKDAIALLKADHKAVDALSADFAYEAKVMVLCECVKHHVKEEHGQMFPKAKATKLDMMALGAQLAARKEALLAAMG